MTTATPCPVCKAPAGEWCRRHGQTQPGPLLCCPERVTPAHVCDICQTITPAILWHFVANSDGTPDTARQYCPACWDDLPADEVTE